MRSSVNLGGGCLAGRLKNLGTCHGHPALAQLASCQFCQLELGAIKKAMHVAAESIMGVSREQLD